MKNQPKSYVITKKNFKGHKENGFSLVEILVVIGILAVVGTIVTSLVINATQSNQKFSASTMTSGELQDSITHITTQVTLANQITNATPSTLQVKTMEDGIEYQTSYFYWDKDAASAPPGVDKNKLPNKFSYIEYKQNMATNNVMVKMLISDYQRDSSAKPVFTYYDQANEAMVSPVQVDNLIKIKRVAIYFSVQPEGREEPMELATSAVPRYDKVDSSASTGASVPIPSATVLRGTLDPGTTTANLEWNSVAGSTQYNLYRDNQLILSAGPNTTTFADENREWGATYEYHVIVVGYAGSSQQSNTVRLTVVPQQTRFVNINTTAPRDKVQTAATETGTTNPLVGTTYTVARNLENRLTWESRSGATGYRLIDGAGTTLYNGPNTTYIHPRAYGNVTDYRVIPYNSGENGSGGNGLISDPANLISPPIAPPIAVTANDTGTGSTSTNTIDTTPVPNALGYRYKKGPTSSVSTTPWTSGPALRVTDTVAWGSTTYYAVNGYNDAGDGPNSIVRSGLQRPGPFAISGITQVQRAKYTNNLEYDGKVTEDHDGSLRGTWGVAAGAANGYTVRINTLETWGGAQVAGTTDRSVNTTSTSLTTNVITPGTIYNYYVTARAANGLTRTATVQHVQTAPDVPRNGQVWMVCSNLSVGQRMNHIYSGNTSPIYGAADRTYQTQFSNNGRGSGLNKTLSLGTNSERTNSDGDIHNYTSGFVLQNRLDLRSGVEYYDDYSSVIRAYGTYKSPYGPGTYGSWQGCGSAGTWLEPVDPCYGYQTGFPNCGQGYGKPSWRYIS